MAPISLPNLQELVEAGIITPETAGNIKEWYELKKEPGSNRFILVLGIFGSLLVGLGIILLVAHNWDQFSRLIKTFFSFLPLLLAQVICLFVLIRKKDNAVWSESSAVFLFFSIAASMALISQVYHVNGSLSSFLLTWLLLSFPLIYIMPSSGVSMLYIGVSTWYGVEIGYFGMFNSNHTEMPYWYLILLALAFPHYYHLWKNRKESNFFTLHNWVIAVSLIIMLGTFMGSRYPYPEWAFVGYLTLFSIFYGIGRSVYFTRSKAIANPFLLLGIAGVIVILMIWSFGEVGKEIVADHSNKTAFFTWLFSYITIAFLIVNCLLIFVLQKSKALINYSPVEISPFILALSILAISHFPPVAPFMINGWILLIGLYYVRRGSRENHLGILNFGLLIILTLAVIRFFDDSIPFVWRGLFFLVTGAGFFIANYWMLRKRKQAINQNHLS